MRLARHGRGPHAAITAVASQIHPVFMLPPIAASWFGAMLTGEFVLSLAAIHSVAIFAAVYTAHVKDGYVDFYRRGEDEDHPLTERGCRICLVGATALFAGTMVLLWSLVDGVAVLLTLPCWLIAYHHAPQLDMHPVGVTLGYPTGIALAILGGYYVQAMGLSGLPIAFAVVFLLLIAGVKVIDDEQDYAYDRSIDKPTVAVLAGIRRARWVAALAMVLALAAVPAFVLVGIFPAGTLLAAGAFAGVLMLAAPAPPETATALLIRGSYVFLGLLVAAVWFQPFS